ncbi:bifunctional homocysteine S-methyltransferase/methylenetetrahydrofolate reductase [Ferviditalea candida]|uniref:Bifunctional homocysteine S-methyltransferase/methylenetetrahydrofolate reductase n=1 Tax=Ferviditalea candida TaxID=3108399 RepID=A0ABU5ZFG4_9BACL|nr:bifunctional homocysteine S-methyltransferase/methylenetetrahydrofolate reductase [Paenibacillaceae bacterium T2]
MKPDLRQALKERILVGDGAMGTYLYQLGFPVGISYEELNLSRPEVIAEVHRRYYEAGARIIETNTFSANREKLSKYGLEGEVEAINRAGVSIARGAVGTDAYVVGSVGSIRGGLRKNMRTEQIKQDFKHQIELLLDAGVDGILLETFYDLEEMRIALKIVRDLSDVAVICQFATEGVSRTQDGYTMTEAFDLLMKEGADVIGFNCRSGPNGILRSMESLPELRQAPLSVFPNAGMPDYVDGKITYMATPEYFAECSLKFADLGSRIVGGCCGTTPEHIAAIAKAVQGYQPVERGDSAVKLAPEEDADGGPAVEIAEPGEPDAGEPSILDLVRQRHTVIIELDPPRDLDIGKFMAGAEALKAAGADAITMADNSLALTRMSNLAIGTLIKEKLGIRPLVHIACRDRNLIGTQSHLMGLDALGINHVLAVTGDPARFGDLPGSSSVYDMTSFEIIRMIKQLNEGLAFSGKPLKQKANFVVGAAFNPNVKHLDKAVQRLQRKIDSGADFIMTQPVYDPLQIEQVYEATKHMNVPIFIGIMPLASGRNAEYLHNEVPGIQLSDEVRRRMAHLEGEAGRKVGLEIAEELLDSAMKVFNGIYLITPFLLYEMTAELTKYVWKKTNRRDFHLSPLLK